MNYRLAAPFTSLSCLAAVDNAGAEEKVPFISVCDAELFKTCAKDRLGSLTQYFGATMIEKGTKISAAHSHAVLCGKKDSLVIAEAVSEMRADSQFSHGNSFNEKLFLIISSLSNPYEPTFSYSSGSNRDQKDNA